jgi:hypothetical protein
MMMCAATTSTVPSNRTTEREARRSRSEKQRRQDRERRGWRGKNDKYLFNAVEKYKLLRVW